MTEPWRNRIAGQALVPPGDLLANPNNWRTHPGPQRDALRGSLATVGWVQQVIVNTVTGHVVDGHARIEEALTRDEPTVPVLYVDLTQDEENLVLASLDPIGAMAGSDQARLADLLAEVTVDDEALRRMLGDLLDEPKQGKSDPDDIPEISGDVYVKLLVTDPPYGVKLDPRWRDGIYNALGPAEKPYMRIAGHRNTTLSGDTRVDWSEAFELVPSLQVGYVWHAGVHAAEVATGLVGIGFEVVAQVIWDKGLFAMGRSWYHWRHEPCWVVRKPGVPNLFIGERNQSTVWEAPSPKMIMGGSTEEKQDHPAQKPVAVIEPAIRNHRGDVYDPFVGSGTTLIAAEQHRRACYAMEIDPKYAQITIERWQAFTGEKAECQ